MKDDARLLNRGGDSLSPLAPACLRTAFLLIALTCARPVWGEVVPVTLTVSNTPAYAIPADFSGLSFGAVAELPASRRLNRGIQ